MASSVPNFLKQRQVGDFQQTKQGPFSKTMNEPRYRSFVTNYFKLRADIQGPPQPQRQKRNKVIPCAMQSSLNLMIYYSSCTKTP